MPKGRVPFGFMVLLLMWVMLSGAGCHRPAGQVPTRPGTSDDDPVATLDRAIASRDWSLASQIAAEAMIARPNDPHVLTQVAIAKGQSGRQMEAARLLVDAADADKLDPQGGRVDNALTALLSVGLLHDAIDLLQRVVEAHPEAGTYRRSLVGFLGEAQLIERIGPHMSALIQSRQFDLPLLLATTEMSTRRFSSDAIGVMLERNPSDLRPRLGEARALLDQRDATSAERLLRLIVDRHPNFAAAQAMLGQALATQGKTDQIAKWHKSLPSDVRQWSGYWIAVGQWATSNGQVIAAVRAFTEASRRAPNDAAILSRLGAALRLHVDQSQGRGPAATANADTSDVDVDQIIRSVEKRQDHLLQLRERFTRFKIGEQRSQSVAVEVADSLLKLGRYWEAEAWLAIAVGLPEEPSDEITGFREIVIRRLSDDRRWQSVRGRLELTFDLQGFPIPDDLELAVAADVNPSLRTSPHPPTEIRFSDEAVRRGLEFYGRVGKAVEAPRVPIAQTLGVGGGTIDIDNDGADDLVFAAAGGTLRGDDSDPGAVFRNRDGVFVDVTSVSGLGNTGYGQGVAVGDFNDDGYADLLALNFGRNRLFENNGDGTFTDRSESLPGQGGGDWSTSGVITDVDHDGVSDLVVVNYCDADQPLSEPCFDADGREINCYPLRFRAGRDRFLKGLGDGSFSDATDDWTETPMVGRGLGVVAGRLDGRRSGLYIVNDASPNSYYTHDDGRLTDRGIASGLAVDAQSLDQGSMGIASADFDRDGDLDFYVTGFADEYNIFYEQRTAGTWSDRTASMGLVEPTLRTVGFGSEAIDMDNNGDVELVVTNGHVGNFGPGSPPYAQPIQFFRHSDGRFESIPVESWGEYFGRAHVGRALFTCDANSDGLLDIAVTHSTEPVALLINTSVGEYHRVGFRVVDTAGPRDAVGAIVTFRTEEDPRRRVEQRLAGDGYMCANQPQMYAGIGNSGVLQDVTVHWPDGQEEVLGDLPSDALYLLVRGQPPFTLRQLR